MYLQKDLKTLQALMIEAKLFADGNYPPPNTTPPLNINNVDVNTSSLLCYTCGKPGHLASAHRKAQGSGHSRPKTPYKPRPAEHAPAQKGGSPHSADKSQRKRPAVDGNKPVKPRMEANGRHCNKPGHNTLYCTAPPLTTPDFQDQ